MNIDEDEGGTEQVDGDDGDGSDLHVDDEDDGEEEGGSIVVDFRKEAVDVFLRVCVVVTGSFCFDCNVTAAFVSS